jgi:hypothetical protein
LRAFLAVIALPADVAGPPERAVFDFDIFNPLSNYCCIDSALSGPEAVSTFIAQRIYSMLILRANLILVAASHYALDLSQIDQLAVTCSPHGDFGAALISGLLPPCQPTHLQSERQSRSGKILGG